MYAHGDCFIFIYLFIYLLIYLFIYCDLISHFFLFFLSLSSLFVFLILSISYAGPFETRLICVDVVI